MKKLYRGFLFCVEGVDGSGKSLLSNNLYYRLKDLKQNVALTKEPGGTPFGEKVYNTLINADFMLTPQAEFLLFAASRAEHFDKVIIPQLKDHAIVISDRMADSSLIYQGYAQGLDMNMLRTVNQWVMQNITPDMTFYVRIELKTILERLRQRNTPTHIFEKEHEFLQKTIDGFDKLYNDRDDVVILDGTLDPLTLVQQALDQIKFTLATQ